MFLIHSDSQEPVPENGVIKAEFYTIQCEAEAIIARAKAEADQLRQDAREAYEAELVKAREEGLQQGREQAARDIFERAAEGLSYFERIHSEVAALIMKAVRNVVGDACSDELIELNISRCLQSARGQKFATLKVAPGQVTDAEDKVKAILAENALFDHIEVQGDSKLQEGGCVLVSELGVVDATLDTQLQALEASLHNAIR